MEDMLIALGVNAILAIVRNPEGKGKWRRALLKVFREIGRAFSNDAEFVSVARAIGPDVTLSK